MGWRRVRVLVLLAVCALWLVRRHRRGVPVRWRYPEEVWAVRYRA